MSLGNYSTGSLKNKRKNTPQQNPKQNPLNWWIPVAKSTQNHPALFLFIQKCGIISSQSFFHPFFLFFDLKSEEALTKERAGHKISFCNTDKLFCKKNPIEESIPLSRRECYFLRMPTAIPILLLVNKHLVLRSTL